MNSKPFEEWVLYVTNHFTHPVLDAQAASPRHHLARKLSEKGQKLLVYCPLGRHVGSPAKDFLTNLFPEKRVTGNAVILFPPLIVSPSSATTPLALVMATAFILAYLTITRVKIAAQYGTTVLVGSVGAALKSVKKIPLVVNYGDPDFAREHGLARKAFGICERLVLSPRAAYAVVYIDEVIGTYVRTRFRVQRTFFLPNGGYEEGSTPPARGGHEASAVTAALGLEGKRVVIYVGQVSHTYRLDLLVSTAEATPALENLVFVLAGEGPALRSLVENVKARRLEKRFRFLGPIPYSSTGPYLAASDVGVQLLPDMCMGTKVMMYMANRLPVVSIGGWYDRYGEFLKDGKNVVLLPPDAGRLGTALASLLSDPKRLDRLGESGWETVKPYSWDRHADETLRLLREAAGRENAA